MSEDLQQQFAENSGAFALDLYSVVNNEGNSNKNIIVSPFSIQTCVALAFAGALGKTAQEISKGLHLVSEDRKVVGESFQSVLDAYKDSPYLKIANKIFVKIGYEVKKEFNEIATKSFHSEAENLEFSKSDEAAGVMNGWVEAKTNGKITKLISPDSLDEDTRMVLINAIHFKCEWKNKFDKDATVDDDFWLNENDSVKVPMMNHKKNYRYGVLEDLDATVLDMPYKDSDLSMLVLLPNSKTGLKDLEAKLKNVSINDIVKKMFPSDVIVKFPKFKVEFEIELNNVLKEMGMGTMFGSNADFGNLLNSPEQLVVSKVIHKACIEVNEEGAEAAAATAMKIRMKRSLITSIETHEFNVQHQFVYIIFDKKNQIPLFFGSMKSDFRDNKVKHDEL